METKTTTRIRLLDAAYALMLRKGYPATSVDDICQAADVSKGSFYHFFKSKQDLAIGVLEHHMDGAMEQIEAGLNLEGLDGVQRTLAYVRQIEAGSEELWSDGCLIGSFALALAETHPEIRSKVSDIFRDLEDHMEKIFEPLTRPGDPQSPPARELAEQFLVVIEGGVVLAKAHRDRRYLPQAIRCFRRYLEMLAQGQHTANC